MGEKRTTGEMGASGVGQNKYIMSGETIPKPKRRGNEDSQLYNIQRLIQRYRNDDTNEDKMPTRADFNRWLLGMDRGFVKVPPNLFNAAVSGYNRAILRAENKQYRSDVNQIAKDERADATRQLTEVQKDLRINKKAIARREKDLSNDEDMQLNIQTELTELSNRPGLNTTINPGGYKRMVTKKYLDKAKATDPELRNLMEERDTLQKTRTALGIRRKRKLPPRPQRPQKERPSGGGTLTVDEDIQKYKRTTDKEYRDSGERYKKDGVSKQGTIYTSQGPWQGATQGKLEPDGKGGYQRYTRKTNTKKGATPSMSKPWSPKGYISAGDVYDITKGKYGEQGVYNQDSGEEDVSAEDYRIGEEAREELNARQRDAGLGQLDHGREKPYPYVPEDAIEREYPYQPEDVIGSDISERTGVRPGKGPILERTGRLERPTAGRLSNTGDAKFNLDSRYRSPMSPYGGYFSGLEEEENPWLRNAGKKILGGLSSGLERGAEALESDWDLRRAAQQGFEWLTPGRGLAPQRRIEDDLEYAEHYPDDEDDEDYYVEDPDNAEYWNF